MPKLSHFRKRGEVAMVDVTPKAVTERTALARGFVRMSPKVLACALRQQKVPGLGIPWKLRVLRGLRRGEAHGGMDTSLSSTAAQAH